jgi:hypothetical protein
VDIVFVSLQLGLTVTLGFFSYYYQALSHPCYAAYGDTTPLDAT